MNQQEKFWKEDFGAEYLRRNRVDWRKRIPFWQKTVDALPIHSILEVGCSAGWNLMALREVNPDFQLRGVDLNLDALCEAVDNGLDVKEMGASEVGTLWPKQFDLVLTSGVLIHVAPEHLKGAMDSIVKASKRFVVAIEYDCEEPTEIPYRGHAERLWKRPFGKMYKDLGLHLVSVSEAEGFDRCTAWVLERA